MLTILAVAAMLAILAIVLLTTGILGQSDPNQSTAAPHEVSVQELREFAGPRRSTVYWAGALPARRLELTEAGENVFVRYLTGDAVVRDGRPATTVGTYPVDGAYTEVRKRSGARGMESQPAPGGGLATWSGKRPTSVYMGFPRSDTLIEVYDPDPERARKLVLSGDVGPVR